MNHGLSHIFYYSFSDDETQKSSCNDQEQVEGDEPSELQVRSECNGI